jgi:RNA polymerase sigma-70 factor (ECF subfamily)
MADGNLGAASREVIERVYREESRRVFATLVRMLGDFDLAEEALHEAFASALQQWPGEGVPGNPRAWLVSAGRFKAIDDMRRRTRHDEAMNDLADRLNRDSTDSVTSMDNDGIEDDRLRLIFTCCHPALPPEARIALTLREVCGLTTEEIARAFLTSAPTIAQRIVRAKSKIKTAKIPYVVPGRTDLPERLETLLQVIYLVFNEGYAASSGDSVTRADLSSEAIRLVRLLVELLPETEVIGLLALMLIQESRRAARASSDGDLILLEDQDRSKWNRREIDEGVALVRRALGQQAVGPYTVQAAIAAVHAEAPSSAQTDWSQIAALYDLLLRMTPSPVIELNRAVAIAMRDGPEIGLGQIDAILARGELGDYHLAHAARADLCRRLGLTSDAREAYERALELATQAPERRFLEKRLRDLEN